MIAVHNVLLEYAEPNQADATADTAVEFTAVSVEQTPLLFIHSPSTALALYDDGVHPRENVSETPSELVIMKMEGRSDPVKVELDMMNTEYVTALVPEQVSTYEWGPAYD